MEPMRIYVTEESGAVTNVWVTGVPSDFSDEDVAYSAELVGDRTAMRALPYLRLAIAVNGGRRVYLDEA